MNVNQFPIAVAQLCEGVFYGLFLATCWLCARTLLFKNTDEGMRLVHLCEVRWVLTVVSTTFLIISTWDMVTGILYLFNAFNEAGGPTGQFNGPSGWINIARVLNQALAILLGDFVLIFKCWIVYGRRWSVIAPSLLLLLGAIATAIRLVEIGVASRADETPTLEFCPWAAAMFGVHAVQNILTSGMLIWRISCVGRPINQNTNCPGGYKAFPPRPMQRYMQAVAESGAVYTATVLVTFLTSATRSNAVYIALNMSLQTAGIASNLIIVRSIERDDREVCIGVASPQNLGRSMLMFSRSVQDASIELNTFSFTERVPTPGINK